MYLGSRGQDYDLIKIEAGGSRSPFASDTAIDATKIRITNNRSAYAHAIASMVATSSAALDAAKLSLSEIDWWVPHQANIRLIEAVRHQLSIPNERVLLTLADCANSSAATIPVTLSIHQHKLAVGQTVLMTAVGAGFTEAAMVYRL